jgi:hypothetical protein
MAKSDNGDGPKPKVNIAGTVPANEFNGLMEILDEINEKPHVRRRAVIEWDAASVNRITDTQQKVPTIRIHQIEPLNADDQAFDVDCRRFLDERVKARPGQSEMSFDSSPHP